MAGDDDERCHSSGEQQILASRPECPLLEIREAPLLAYRVLGAKAEPGSLRGIDNLEAPLIGRQEQLATLMAAMTELSQGTGRLRASAP